MIYGEWRQTFRGLSRDQYLNDSFLKHLGPLGDRVIAVFVAADDAMIEFLDDGSFHVIVENISFTTDTLSKAAVELWNLWSRHNYVQDSS